MISEFTDIESAIGALLGGIVKDSAPLFRAVEPMAVVDRKSALAARARLGAPAAVFGIKGRGKSPESQVVLGDPRVLVFLIATNLRSAGGARLGDVDGVGAYELAHESSTALDGAVITGGRRLVAIDERVVQANERTIVFEQRWVVERPSELVAPMFGGQTITGSDAIVSMQVGPRKSRSISFGFPGIDGTFRHATGTESRTIRWVGQLRGATHAAVTTIETGIEVLLGTGGTSTVSDSIGRSFERCVADAYNRRGSRYVHPLTGQIVQNFELDFVQLGG